MSPFVMTPLLKWTMGALGGALVVQWVIKEVRRVNAELDLAKAKAVTEPRRARLRTLRRDPSTGVYRPD